MEFVHKYPGGTEVELSMLFVDARGSTSIAEQMNAADFSRLMNRFYKAATEVLIRTDALLHWVDQQGRTSSLQER